MTHIHLLPSDVITHCCKAVSNPIVHFVCYYSNQMPRHHYCIKFVIVLCVSHNIAHLWKSIHGGGLEYVFVSVEASMLNGGLPSILIVPIWDVYRVVLAQWPLTLHCFLCWVVHSGGNVFNGLMGHNWAIPTHCFNIPDFSKSSMEMFCLVVISNGLETVTNVRWLTGQCFWNLEH